MESFRWVAGTVIVLLSDVLGDPVLEGLDIGSLGIVLLRLMGVDILGCREVARLIGVQAR